MDWMKGQSFALQDKWQRIRDLPKDASRIFGVKSFIGEFVRKILDSTFYVLLDLYRPVRIGTLNTKGRITIIISYIEPYLRRLKLEGKLEKTILIVLNPGRTPNEHLAWMYKRQCYLIGGEHSWTIKVLRTFYGKLIRGTRLDARLRAGNISEFWEVWNLAQPVLTFTPEEEARGKQLLSAMGIDPGSQFMCFCTREESYYKKLHADWPHWNWQDTFHRNSDILDYLPSAQYCAEQGIYALRVGVGVDRALPPQANGRIIDYATRFRSDFGDIYLGAHSKFVLSGAAGFWLIGSAFNRPVVWANQIPIQYRPVRDHDLFICKKLWSITEKRFLRFREMIDTGIRYDSLRNCISGGIEVIDNTPEEILAVTREMNARIDGTWVDTEEDEELQRRFQALYKPGHPSFGFRSRIGTAFLREHSHLL